MATPAGFYDDGAGRQRYWDGNGWTNEYADTPASPVPVRAPRIRVKMVTGEEFSISQRFYGSSGAIDTHDDAEIQMSFLISKMATVTVDEGKMLNVAQIVYTWIED